MIIGIDLGTTNSVAAYLTDDGPQLIPNALGKFLTPSVVAIDEQDTLLVGQTAKEYQVLHPERAVGVFKRNMGTDWKVKLAGRDFTPELLSSLVLNSLKQDAEKHLGIPITDAVITVPAYFHDHQRKATINAGKLAGLNVLRIINEPTAAAMAYGLHEAAADKVIMVVDLGGGTFDVSVVEMFEGTLEVRASSGESILGGEDFTRTLCARLLEQRGRNFERSEMDAPLLTARLLQQCEAAKQRLTREPTVTIRCPNESGEFTENLPDFQVTREQLDSWCEKLLARVELPIRRTLGDAGLKRSDIQEVLLVGGATRMPMFIDRMRCFFDRDPQCRLNPDHVVALGAAIQAGLTADHRGVGDLVVTDVAPFTLGVEISKTFGHEQRSGYFLPIIQRNTTIPCSHVERVSTVRPNQTEVSIKVYQGENRRTENNQLLGEFSVTGIPRGPAGQEVDIRFTYDLNGVLEVEATIVSTKQQMNHVITKHASGLSELELQAALKQLKKLKEHPRDDAMNRFVLRRAERLYSELPQDEREYLGQLLDGYEQVMNLRDMAAIERYRSELQAFCDRFDHPENGDFGDE